MLVKLILGHYIEIHDISFAFLSKNLALFWPYAHNDDVYY